MMCVMIMYGRLWVYNAPVIIVHCACTAYTRFSAFHRLPGPLWITMV